MEAQENKQEKKVELAPCPFCGETEKVYLRRGHFGDAFVMCGSCRATTAFFDDTERKKAAQIARDAWNMRREPVYVIREPETEGETDPERG